MVFKEGISKLVLEFWLHICISPFFTLYIMVIANFNIFKIQIVLHYLLLYPMNDFMIVLTVSILDEKLSKTLDIIDKEFI